MGTTSRRPLRFGVMGAADGLTEFARRCMEHLTRDGLAEPAVLIVDRRQARPNPWQVKVARGLRLDGNLWHLQSKLFSTQELPLYRRLPLDEVLPGVPRMVCHPTRRGKWSEYFSAEDVEAIRALDLDFILKHAYGIIRGDVLQAARYGVWSFHHDDEQVYRGGPPGFWEVYHDDPVTGVILQRLNDRLDGGVVLQKCYAPTDRMSHRRNLSRILESSTHMARWACLDVLQGRLEGVQGAPSTSRAPIYRAPNDAQVLRYWVRLACNRVRRRVVAQRVDEWNVGLVEAPQAAFLDPEFQPRIEWSGYREPQQMVADPFLLPAPGEPRLMVEEYSWSLAKGRIVELRREPGGGPFRVMTPAIDEPWHLSYPQPFAHDGAIYALPECAESEAIRLYRLDQATGEWSFEATLIEGIDAADATVFQHEGRWWLLHAGTEGHRAWSLYAWHAPDLRGPWEPHIANPVKTDVTSSRPGGNVFVHEGQLYRPAQDGRRAYGGAMAIARVDELTPEAFRETVVRRIAPDRDWPYPDGCHTLSGHGGWSVIDAKRHTWPPAFILKRFLGRRLGLVRKAPFSYRQVRLAPPDPLER